MISIYDLKPAFQKCLRPFSDYLAKNAVTPNQITIFTIVFSALVGSLLAIFPAATGVMFFLPVALIFRMMLNAIDGMLAREHQMQSPLGALLNEVGDVLSDAFIYLPFCFVKNVLSAWVVGIVLLATLSELTGLAALQIGAKRRYDGPMGKSDRALAFGVIAFSLAIGVPPGPWLNMVFALIFFLLIVTIVNRMLKALREIQREG